MYTSKATTSNTSGIAGYLKEFANAADLQVRVHVQVNFRYGASYVTSPKTFFRRFRTDAVGATFQTILVNGGLNNQNQPGVEVSGIVFPVTIIDLVAQANLDIQYTEGITFPTPNIYYSTGGSPPFKADSQTPTNTNEPYLDWLNFILNQTSIPQTFTTSYGDDEQTVSQFAAAIRLFECSLQLLHRSRTTTLSMFAIYLLS